MAVEITLFYCYSYYSNIYFKYYFFGMNRFY